MISKFEFALDFLCCQIAVGGENSCQKLLTLSPSNWILINQKHHVLNSYSRKWTEDITSQSKIFVSRPMPHFYISYKSRRRFNSTHFTIYKTWVDASIESISQPEIVHITHTAALWPPLTWQIHDNFPHAQIPHIAPFYDQRLSYKTT